MSKAPVRFTAVLLASLVAGVALVTCDTQDPTMLPTATSPQASVAASEEVPPRLYWQAVSADSLWRYIVRTDTTVTVGVKKPGQRRGYFRGQRLVDASTWTGVLNALHSLGEIEVQEVDSDLPVVRVKVRILLAAGLLLAACGEDPLAPEPFREPLADITANGHHTCALTVSGKAYCWGRGDNGQLGNGGARDEFSPVPVRTGLRFASISAGYYHTCALTDSGKAWCWGANRRQEGSGQIGNGSREGGEEPERVRTSLRFSQITAGQVHTCALTADGEAYCWGGNWYGQLGDGTTTDRTRPVAVEGGLRFRHLSAGADFTCGVTVEGAGYCWGSNFQYTLGTGNPGERCGPSTAACSSVPVVVASEEVFAGVAAGENHACAWTADGTTYCWGSNLGGEIGRGDTVQAAVPAEVVGGYGFAAVEVGTAISCGVDLAGAPYCWGSNRLGQVGNPGVTDDGSSVPVSVGGALRMRTLAAGMFHVCGVTKTGLAYCWGSNRRGEVGVGDAQLEICDPTNGHPCSRTPVRVEGQEFAAAATAPRP